MADPATIRDQLQQHQRRLSTYMRALLPGDDVESAVREAAERILNRPEPGPGGFADRADAIAREVAIERRKAATALPFSDDLFRQLADSAGPILDQVEKRPAALAEVLRQLPPPERELLRRRYELSLTVEQIAGSENRPVALVARDLAALHESLVSALRESLPDGGPEPPGGAADLGRLSDQLLDGSITEDGRLVLETLLLADAAAQAHYHRHAALVADLSWHFVGPPPLPEVPPPEQSRRMTVREWVVTAAFVAAVLTVIGYVVLRLSDHL